MSTFRYFKYATIIKDEKRMIEDALVEKMATWKYDPSKLKREADKDFMKALTIHWDKH